MFFFSRGFACGQVAEYLQPARERKMGTAQEKGKYCSTSQFHQGN